MLGLVVAVIAELVTPLDDVLGRCHDREGNKAKGQVKVMWCATIEKKRIHGNKKRLD